MQWSSRLDVRVQELVFEQRLQALGLKDIWDFVRTQNPSGSEFYHNTHHVFHVARLASQLLHAQGFYRDELHRVLITAALFHDYDHSGGRQPDSANIERAVLGFRACCRTLPDDLFLRAPKNRLMVESLIRATVYPNTDAPASIAEACLRDADLLYSVSDDTVGQVMDGLRLELERREQRPISYTDMLARQQQFVYSATFYTPLAQRLWEQTREAVLQRQNLYAFSQPTPYP